MDRRKRPTLSRCPEGSGVTRGIALSVAFLLAGCGGSSYVQVSSSASPSTGVSTGGSVRVQGTSTLGALIAIGLLAGASHGSDRAMPPSQRVPELDPARRVVEQDCTKPIEDWSANLRCR